MKTDARAREDHEGARIGAAEARAQLVALLLADGLLEA